MNIYGTHQLASSLQLQRTHPAHYSSNNERVSGGAGDVAAVGGGGFRSPNCYETVWNG